MSRNLENEIDSLKKDLADLKELFLAFTNAESDPRPKKALKSIHQMNDMHPDKNLSEKMEELCSHTDEQNISGLITYLGVYSSGGQQSNWIRNEVNTDHLLSLIENHTAEKVLNCVGNGDRLNILLAIMKKPLSVSDLIDTCKLNSTGQAYHHMKPLLAADLIVEDTNNKGVYILQPHKVQGIIMMLAGICDMVDETYTKGIWEQEI